MLRPALFPGTLIAASLLLTLGCSGGNDSPVPARAPAAPTQPVAAAAPTGAKGDQPAREVSFDPQEPWASASGSYSAGFAFDQETRKQPGETPEERPTIVYAQPK